MEQLAKVKTKIGVFVAGSRVTAAGMAKLQSTYPNLVVVDTPFKVP